MYCRCYHILTARTTGTLTTGAFVPDAAPLCDDPGILDDLPAIKGRAERVKIRPVHKDLDGEAARLLAMDVLALIEALEER